MSLLLRAGADASSEDEIGRSALHWAAAEGHLAIVNELLQVASAQSPKKPACTWVTKKRVTPLHLACGAGHAEVAATLLDSGAEAAALDIVGMSPAGWAQKAPTSEYCAVPVRGRKASKPNGDRRHFANENSRGSLIILASVSSP